MNIRYEGLSSIFDIVVKATNERFTVELSLPGEHNVLNALAAIAITTELGIDKEHIKTALQEFQGTSRRFELNGELQLQKKKVVWVDDYGHHPTEILATIKTARIVWPEKRLIVVFQPHRYSRTCEMFENFVDVLNQADILILLEIYSAGEDRIDGINSLSLCNAIKERKGAQVIFEENEEKLLETLKGLASTNDLLLTMGAGSISSIVKQLSSRLISSMGRINQQNVRTGKLSDEDWPRLTSALSLLSESKLFIDDDAYLTPSDIRARVRRLKRTEHELDLIIVDYIQLMQSTGIAENRATELSNISRQLKALAKELDVPVIVLSQLNRSLEQRTDKRPIMSDLRDSGAIEQDADLIAFIYRDEVYNDDSPNKGTAEIIVAKQRNGPIFKTMLSFHGEHVRFDNYTPDIYTPEDVSI